MKVNNIKITYFLLVLSLFSLHCAGLIHNKQSQGNIHAIYPMDNEGYATVVGQVTNARTGEPLLCVEVIVKFPPGLAIGSTSGLFGYYSIMKLTPGRYNFEANVIGYSAADITDIDLNENQILVLDIQLAEAKLLGEEVW
ncbi:MAG: carboxypeptidase regulatory-like domain-containing protein [Candidatus Marinimicrobia bacterium]|nr:carboxypeptidase regulatory-like domain-containing protein [Candidatus Neomarinimicrobiota bacterium]